MLIDSDAIIGFSLIHIEHEVERLIQFESNFYTYLLLSLVFLFISNLTSWLRLYQFLGTKTTEVNKSLKTDANLWILTCSGKIL